MNCTKCNQPLSHGAAFCGNCGQAVAQTAPPTSQTQPVNPQAAQPAVAPQAAPAQPQPVAPAAPPTAGQTAVPPYATQQPSVQPKDATLPLVLGILSLVLWVVPLLGLISSITAIVLAVKAKNVSPNGNGVATAALVMGIVGVVFALLAWGANYQDAMDEKSTVFISAPQVS
ncbi:hypothetical protein CSA80_02750 [Candidatus Saccharibacteria bacterium]|nr:MAG: hypothetical protein CR973_02865 [Candidatus Saccharibacteria bacterium]PID99010.1 MAG: hypothetical protein CSA80_02750 [Candidatus Saccharibacteria bacterium]